MAPALIPVAEAQARLFALGAPMPIEIVPLAAGAVVATVVAHAFLGEKIDYDLRVGESRLSAVRYNAGDVMPDGTDVGLRFAEDALALLPGAKS